MDNLYQMYISENLPPVLTREEEQELGKKLKSKNRKVVKDARIKIVEHNLRLVTKIACDYLYARGRLDFEDLVNTLSNSDYKLVAGSRIQRVGASILRESSRGIISKTVNFIIRKILGMEFQDTQCGAKVMKREIVADMFSKPFLTQWIFDVELFLRMKKYIFIRIYRSERGKIFGAYT